MKKVSLEIPHIDFFHEKGSILFHKLMDAAGVTEYRKLLSHTTTTRNVWKRSDLLKKMSLNPSFAAIAGRLMCLRKLRFGFDHFFPSFEALKTFFSNGSSLSSLASIEGLEIALLLNLSDEQASSEDLFSTLPSLGGSGMFFKAITPFPDLSKIELKGPFLLLTYCHVNAQYTYKITDPFTHDVKKESCAFGDRLANSYHPLVYY